MPPAKPAPKRAPKKAPRPKAHCHTCGARIQIPDGWTVGPAVRRHYWSKHRDVMQRKAKRPAR